MQYAVHVMCPPLHVKDDIDLKDVNCTSMGEAYMCLMK